ncbi:MAG: murein biosynthesis integral membrane protein MurJ, partial [Bdellovibrionales bacterium]|nr:murein biosynthesis integral membrane protein MurJ [Bdellovibrionales bacterium]
MSKKQDSVVKSAIYFATGTFASRVLGLIRDALFVAVFGKTVSDAWLAAFRFPNLFRRIFGEGALSACFIPVYIDHKEQGDDAKRAQLTAGLLMVLSLILIPFTVVMILGMETIMPWIVSGDGFTAVPGKVDMTITMTKIMFPFLYLMSLFAYFMAILNAHKKFMASALAPCYFNLVNIAASLYCYITGEISGTLLSWAVIVGGFFQFVTLLPTFFKLNIPLDWSWRNIYSPSVRKVLRAFVPSLIGLGIVQFMGLINISFASHLQEGSVTYIYLADRLLELPLSMVAVSLGTVLLPTLSERLSRGDVLGFKS